MAKAVQNFIQNGASNFKKHGPKGCRFGKRCKFYHPKLCQNSVELNVCLNQDCKEMHLPGTRRKTSTPDQNKPPNITKTNNPNCDASKSKKPLLPRPPHENLNQADEFHTKPRTETITPPNSTRGEKETSDSLSNDRIFRYLETLKTDLQASIVEQVQSAVKALNHSPQVPVNPPAPAPNTNQTQIIENIAPQQFYPMSQQPQLAQPSQVAPMPPAW